MAGAGAKKGDPIDMAIMLGMPKGKGSEPGDELPPDSEPMAEEEPSADAELPPGFLTAFEEYEAAEGSEARASAFYRAVEACKGGL